MPSLLLLWAQRRVFVKGLVKVKGGTFNRTALNKKLGRHTLSKPGRNIELNQLMQRNPEGVPSAGEQAPILAGSIATLDSNLPLSQKRFNHKGGKLITKRYAASVAGKYPGPFIRRRALSFTFAWSSVISVARCLHETTWDIPHF